ncbi:MAG: hypothetical protein WDN08_12405 [Rhizomicrobium sp.]
MLRAFLAIVGAAIAGIVTMMIMESLSVTLFPLPPGIDLSKSGASAGYVDAMPLGAKLLTLFGWAGASYLGAALATRLAHWPTMLPGLVAGAVTLLAGVLNLAMIPHPWWMWLFGIAALTAPAYYVARQAAPKRVDMRTAA